MTTGFITSGFSLVGQMNLQNDGGVIGPDNTPVVNDKVTSFTSPGTFSGADPKNSGQTGKVILIGGGGGGAHQGGGGGAGGVVVIDSAPLASSFPVTVGGGGSASMSGGSGSTGSNTSAPIGGTTFTAQGGGGSGQRGANYVGPSPTYNGKPGGSGGGGGRGNHNPGQNNPAGSGNQPGVSNPGANQNLGNPGGVGNSPATQDNRVGGGGGGAGGAGSQSTAGIGHEAFPAKSQPQAPGVQDRGYIGGGGGGQAGVNGNQKGGGSPNSYFTPPQALDGSGSGGGSCYNNSNPGTPGGDGGVHVIEFGSGPSVTRGRWSLKAVYSAVKDDNWTN